MKNLINLEMFQDFDFAKLNLKFKLLISKKALFRGKFCLKICHPLSLVYTNPNSKLSGASHYFILLWSSDAVDLSGQQRRSTVVE